MTRLFLILFLVLMIGLMEGGCAPKRQKEDLNKFSSQRQGVKEGGDMDLAETILLPKSYQLDLPRDPFRPLIFEPPLITGDSMESVRETDIKLAGVLVMEGRSRVILDVPTLGIHVFKEGDRIGDYKVKKIDAKKVFLEKDGRSLELKIGDEK